MCDNSMHLKYIRSVNEMCKTDKCGNKLVIYSLMNSIR